MTLGIHVQGYRVLVLPDPITQKIGMFEIPTDKKLERAGQITGTVVSIGPLCWLNHEDTTPWCKVGDAVLYSRFAGKFVDDPITKEQYVILNDEDIIATVDRPTEG